MPSFPAPFRMWLVRNGILMGRKIPYWFKCLVIGPLFYILGASVTLATGTFCEYVSNYPTFVAFLTSSLALYGIVYGCKQVTPTINQLDEAIEHSKDATFQNFISEMKHERSQYLIRDRYWYYVWTFGLAGFSAFIAYIGLIGPPPWVKYAASQNARWINNVYFFGISVPVVGYIAGLGAYLAVK